MEQLELLITQYMTYIILGLGIGCIILLLLNFINLLKMRKLKKRLDRFMSKDDVNLEELLAQYTKKLNVLLQNEEEMQTSIEAMKGMMKDCVQKVGVVRYQAIQNVGADLSYTVALLNKENDGVVLNGIYGRDGCYTYAKPIKSGKSTYNLSEEEEEAINKALNQASM